MGIPSEDIRKSFYSAQYAACTLNAGVIDQAKAIAQKAAPNLYLYEQIGFPFQVPWQAIAALHYMECGLDTTLHLANGDPLTVDTTHAPVALMAPTQPPYAFVDAGIAALARYRSIWGVAPISDVVSTLQLCDQWDGLMFWKLNPPEPSPYLWAGTSIYEAGDFINGVYDPTAPSLRIGVAAILKALGVK